MNIQEFLTNILLFLNVRILPAMIAIAGFFFLVNAVRYFIIGGANEESQEKARTLATWGIAAFVLIVSLWGIVNLVVAGFGFTGSYSRTPDYLCEKSWNGCTKGNN